MTKQTKQSLCHPLSKDLCTQKLLEVVLDIHSPKELLKEEMPFKKQACQMDGI